jgi:hypothetical protein
MSVLLVIFSDGKESTVPRVLVQDNLGLVYSVAEYQTPKFGNLICMLCQGPVGGPGEGGFFGPPARGVS